ncbi:hypothetical protein A2165_03215 [Candidatus Curtissbacteria bacterium RBG_13_40_7]|uniref:Uncharacterized protein n=1 Tax=Candidatus Curtissbacteria bacterium RBG_13_40_7 TaxID=1797706 RepID=A0A1F5FYR3_9BACT|nr:MAG: hypothetical protein A2165_03215 [Candidatus Curtissbacteria bacterium RBG_13_40_7]
MSLSFLKPRLANVLLTLVILSLPIFWEREPLPTGGYSVVAYRPIFLLASYLQMNDYYPFFQMVGFSFAVYFGVSLAILILTVLWGKTKKFRKAL